MQPVLVDGPKTYSLPYPEGAGPISSADFNNDSQPDLAVYNQSSWILFLNSNGDFSVKTNVVGGQDMVLGDFNSDGFVDMTSGGQLQLGNGDGTFTEQGNWFYVLGAGDFDGDGQTDIVHHQDGTNVVSFNGGNMVYNQVGILPAGRVSVARFFANDRLQIAVVEPSMLKMFDWSNDSFLCTTNFIAAGEIRPFQLDSNESDDFVAIGTNDLRLFSSDGSGTFQLMATFPTATSPTFQIAAGDFNGDGWVDLISSTGLDSLWIRYGTTNGWAEPDYYYGNYGNSMLAADLDGDTTSDLVTAGFTGEAYPRLEIFPSTTAPLSRLLPLFQTFPMAQADFNADGCSDVAALAVSTGVDYSLATLYRTGEGAFDFKIRALRTYALSGSVGDLNRDGHLDIMMRGLGGFITFLGDGTGSFERAPTLLKVDDAGHATAVADFNGDQINDALLASDTKVFLAIGRGNGTFKPTFNVAANHGALQMKSCDWNNDGKADFVCGTTEALRIYAGNGDGSFTLRYSKRFTNTNFAGLNFDVGDFNDDDRMDVALTWPTISILFQSRQGTFVASNVYQPTESAYGFQQGDFNGDGYSDLLFYDEFIASHPKTKFLLGTSTGGFEVQVLEQILRGPADYNGDGKPDFLSHAAVHYNETPFRKRSDLLWRDAAGGVHSWLFRGTNFTETARLNESRTVHPEWRSTGTGDFNGDGERDLVWQHDDGRITAWIMRGARVLRTELIRTGPAASTGWRIVATDDFNKDEQTDFLWQNTSGQLRIWLMNGTNVTASTLLRDGKPVAASRRLVTSADFNADGFPDILWENDKRLLSVWLMHGTEPTSSLELRGGTAVNPGWRAVAVHDLDEDNTPDILFQHDTGRVAAWFMNGTTFKGASVLRNNLPAPAGWDVFGAK